MYPGFLPLSLPGHPVKCSFLPKPGGLTKSQCPVSLSLITAFPASCSAWPWDSFSRNAEGLDLGAEMLAGNSSRPPREEGVRYRWAGNNPGPFMEKVWRDVSVPSLYPLLG